MDKLYQAALRCVPGIGNARLSALIDYFGDGHTVWHVKQDDLAFSHVLDTETCNKFIKGREKIDIQQLSSYWDRLGIKIITRGCDEYPDQLRNVYDAPQVLFYKGMLPDNSNLIAIVGARKSSSYGKNAARMIAGDLARSGCWVVSGAARGIDTAAHEGALDAGYTIAVIGNGINVNYPPENARLLSRIATCGAVISEYPPDTPPVAGHFPARNRIINGLSLGVVIIEAAEKSGALITADYALEEGRDVFAVPGSIFSATSKGCHRLIKQGAKLVENASDILEDYQIRLSSPPRVDTLNIEEEGVMQLLDYEASLSLEEIAIKSTLAPTRLTYILLQLELRGLVAQQNGQRYIRIAGRKSE